MTAEKNGLKGKRMDVRADPGRPVIPRRHFFYALQCGLPLLLGLAVYLACGKSVYVTVWLKQRLGLADWGAPGMSGAAGIFVTGYLADMLWAYALTFALSWVLGPGRKERRTAGITASLLGILLECLQVFHTIPGTGDILDMFLECAAALAAVCIIHFIEEKKK